MQNRYLILRSFTFDFLYRAETFMLQDTKYVFEWLDDQQRDAFFSILGTQPTPDYHVPLYSRIEDGGFGLLPYASLQPFLCHKALVRSSPYVSTFFNTFHTLDQYKGLESFPSTACVWTKLFRKSFTPSNTHQLNTTSKSFIRNNGFYSWLESWPKNSIRTLADEDFSFACLLRLNHLTPQSFLCPVLKQDLITLSPPDYTYNLFSCRTCGALQFHHRHEYVTNMLSRTLKCHNILNFPNPKDLPAPEKTRGGADNRVSHEGVFYAVDVAIAKEKKATETNKRTALIYKRKIRNYERYKSLYQHKIVPFVLSIHGIIYSKTLEDIKPWYSTPFFNRFLRDDIIANVQFALIRGIRQGITLLHQRTNQVIDFSTMLKSLGISNDIDSSSSASDTEEDQTF